MASTVSKSIAAELQRQGINQNELARRMKASKSRVSDWVTGKNDPSLTNLRRIARALKVPVAELLR